VLGIAVLHAALADIVLSLNLWNTVIASEIAAVIAASVIVAALVLRDALRDQKFRALRASQFHVCTHCGYVLDDEHDGKPCPECGEMVDLERCRKEWMKVVGK
jgi:predicted RNA-binding Zn-ribbon protein involved in translation (DUF1610 family)